MAASNFNEDVKDFEEHRKQLFHNYQQNYTMTQNPEQVSQCQPQFQKVYDSPVYVPLHIFHYYINTTTSFFKKHLHQPQLLNCNFCRN